MQTKPPELAVGEGAEAQTAAILAGLVDETGNTGSYIAGSNIQPVNIQKFVNGNPTEQVIWLTVFQTVVSSSRTTLNLEICSFMQTDSIVV